MVKFGENGQKSYEARECNIHGVMECLDILGGILYSIEKGELGLTKEKSDYLRGRVDWAMDELSKACKITGIDKQKYYEGLL
jgi:hypothetical protein